MVWHTFNKTLGESGHTFSVQSVAQWLSADGETAPIAMLITSVKP